VAVDPGALTVAVPTGAHSFTIGVDARPGAETVFPELITWAGPMTPR
jgi:hypothetical protein